LAAYEGKDMDEREKNILSVHLKEAELLRNESLLCIALIRRINITVVTIIGVALPAIAGIMSRQFEGGSRTAEGGGFSLMPLDAQTRDIIFGICLGAGIACAALLRIYVGIFKQIFNFARYFRKVLIPNINAILSMSSSRDVFRWEFWLQDQRRDGPLSLGDSDLYAEPALISLVTLFFGIVAFVVARSDDSLFPVAVIFLGFLLLTCVLSCLSIYRVLNDSTSIEGNSIHE
jgi:hypothetical protein